MKKLIFLLLPLMLVSSNCKQNCVCPLYDPPMAYLTINFKPTFDNKPFIINQIYEIDGKKVRFTRLSFLITETCAKTSELDGSCGNDAYLVDLTTLDDSTKSAKGFTPFLNTATKLGTMRGLQMGLGVTKNLNVLKPKDFSNSNTLSDAGLYWNDWNSYIFTKLEGLMDKDGDGRFETGITLHTGGDDSFRPIWFPKNLNFEANTLINLNFEVNVNTILRGIDLSIVNSTHQTGDKPTMLKLMDNLKNAVTLK